VAVTDLACPSCDFRYFFNPTIGTAGFIEDERERLLLIRRGRSPAKGKLAPPGGFADYMESAEQALSREVREETGLIIEQWDYLTSAVNLYAYAGITYPVIDFFYTAKAASDAILVACEEETSAVDWFPIHEVQPEALAFLSMQTAFEAYLARRAPGP
jgi:ADP-ribose pyrophosphatase YjhB (NUDIX family)